MKRVASLYLPNWSIDRVRRAERSAAPPASAVARQAQPAGSATAPTGEPARAEFDAIGKVAASERAAHCSVPKEGGWRPGARWAQAVSKQPESAADSEIAQQEKSDLAEGSGLADSREEVETAVAALPAHRRPPQRELGRVSEAADNPFKQEPFRRGLSRSPEERVAPPAPLTAQARPANMRELSRRTEAAEHPFKPDARESFPHVPRRGGALSPEVEAGIAALPSHQRPSFGELSRRSEVLGSPFRPMPPDEAGASPRWTQAPLQFPGEDAPAKAARGVGTAARARDRHRNEVPDGLSLARAAAMPSVHHPGEDVAARREQRDGRSPKRSARDGHGGEAGYIAPPNLAQLALMPAVQFPGEGPHPDNHGKSEPTAPTYGEGRFFQTGRTMGSLVSRVCPDMPEQGAPFVPVTGQPPLVTVHKIGARVEIAAACPVARALGLVPGMALTQARVQVPGLDVRDADHEGDRADLLALAHLLARRWTPAVAVSDADGLFLDLTGVAHLHGSEARMMRRLHRLLARRGVAARVAVADSAGAAWALARFGAREVDITPPGASAALIAPLPVHALRLDAPSLELLARLGVDTVGRLQSLSRAPLVRRFGPAIVNRLDQATGRAPEPLDPVTPPTPIAVTQRFAEPIATAEAIAHWLGELTPRLAHALAEAGQGARAVELVAARVDGVPQCLRVGFARPTRDAAHMLRLAIRRIEEIAPGYGIDALTLHVRRADPLAPEPLAPRLAEASVPDLAPLVDALANRIGAERLWRVTPVESDVPERSVATAPPLDPPPDAARALRADDVRGLDRTAPDHPWHPRWPRPVRLLHRPEQVDHVLAELPDQPPRRFTWRGRTHLVVRADGPERIAGEWWRRPAERQAVRDYFHVEDEAGERFWLYRRGDGLRPETGDLRWFMHGRYI